MKRIVLLLTLTSIMALLPSAVFAQAPDISGTWVGDTTFPGTTEKDRLTLVLQKSDPAYTGTLSDVQGLIKNTALESITYDDGGTLRFFVTITSGGNDVRLRITLNEIAGRLMGGWGGNNGTFGTIDLTKQDKQDQEGVRGSESHGAGNIHGTFSQED